MWIAARADYLALKAYRAKKKRSVFLRWELVENSSKKVRSCCSYQLGRILDPANTSGIAVFHFESFFLFLRGGVLTEAPLPAPDELSDPNMTFPTHSGSKSVARTSGCDLPTLELQEKYAQLAHSPS